MPRNETQRQAPAQLMTIPQVIEALQLGRTRVWELVASGELPSVRIGRSVRVDAEDLERWIADRKVAS